MAFGLLKIKNLKNEISKRPTAPTIKYKKCIMCLNVNTIILDYRNKKYSYRIYDLLAFY